MNDREYIRLKRELIQLIRGDKLQKVILKLKFTKEELRFLISLVEKNEERKWEKISVVCIPLDRRP